MSIEASASSSSLRYMVLMQYDAPEYSESTLSVMCHFSLAGLSGWSLKR